MGCKNGRCCGHDAPRGPAAEDDDNKEEGEVEILEEQPAPEPRRRIREHVGIPPQVPVIPASVRAADPELVLGPPMLAYAQALASSVRKNHEFEHMRTKGVRAEMDKLRDTRAEEIRWEYRGMAKPSGL